jgi:hypothetical protein
MSKKRERGWWNKNDRWAMDGREGKMVMVDGLWANQEIFSYEKKHVSYTYAYMYTCILTYIPVYV